MLHIHVPQKRSIESVCWSAAHGLAVSEGILFHHASAGNLLHIIQDSQGDICLQDLSLEVLCRRKQQSLEQEQQEDVVYDGGFRVPGDLHDRLLDFQKTGEALRIKLHAM